MKFAIVFKNIRSYFQFHIFYIFYCGNIKYQRQHFKTKKKLKIVKENFKENFNIILL